MRKSLITPFIALALFGSATACSQEEPTSCEPGYFLETDEDGTECEPDSNNNGIDDEEEGLEEEPAAEEEDSDKDKPRKSKPRRRK